MSPAVDSYLAALGADPGSALIATDFDGTLAKLVEDPEQARPEPESVDLLVAIAGRVRRCAVVSGRPVEFLRHRLGPAAAAALWLFGRYGGERAVPGSPLPPEVNPRALREAFETVIAQVRTLAPRSRVEDKGESLALHWREAPEEEAAVRRVAAEAALAFPLEVREGKMLVDLMASGAPNKGQVLDGLLADATSALFVGDDVGDLPAFAALERFAGRGGAALRVVVGGAELPEDLERRADLVLPGPDAVPVFFRQLLVAAGG